MSLTVALAQSNCIVGYVEANAERIKALYDIAVVAQADLVVFPEMIITGYPIEDLALSVPFQTLSMDAIRQLALLTTQGPALLLGGLWSEGNMLYNAAFLLDKGEITHTQYKHHLPNYGVFDEKRIFTAGQMPEPIEWRGTKIGILICEDMWQPDVSLYLKNAGAELLISLNASPYEIGKAELREKIAAERARETGLPLVYVNQAGGQDELVFDGGSFVVSAQGNICSRLPACRQDIAIVSLPPEPGTLYPLRSREQSIYNAMMLGLHDFVQKNGFSGIILGMSGGIDSALSAAIACDALGKERVHCLMLPSPFTSSDSKEDAAECAAMLGVQLDTIAITPGMQGFADMLTTRFAAIPPAILTENNQTRLRSSVLMALAQHDNMLMLNTSNKSEMAVGYTNLYGDMCGHYSVLKDVYKTTVYSLAQWRNSQGRVIPDRILTKAPSAELKPSQKDEDSLPPYTILDTILVGLIEHNLSADEVIAQGFERTLVEQVSHRVFAAEYKRRQSCPGVKISGMSFNRDRRYPLSSGWRGMNINMHGYAL